MTRQQELLNLLSRATPLERQLLINRYILKHGGDTDFIMYLLGINNNRTRINPDRIYPNQFSPFQILGLPNTASISEVNSAYRKQCLRNHPDKGGDPNKFVEITKAKNECIKILTAK